MLETLDYDRPKAVDYAHRWGYFRNPKYYDFTDIGGDCTNFASQCIFAGAGYQNYTKTYGWYYLSVRDRAPAWTGVPYLYNFLVGNRGAGPFGRDVPLSELEPGDVIQLDLFRGYFHHTPVVVGVDAPTPDGIFLAAHSSNCDCRPLSSYDYKKIRCVHIDGVRRPV